MRISIKTSDEIFHIVFVKKSCFFFFCVVVCVTRLGYFSPTIGSPNVVSPKANSPNSPDAQKSFPWVLRFPEKDIERTAHEIRIKLSYCFCSKQIKQTILWWFSISSSRPCRFSSWSVLELSSTSVYNNYIDDGYSQILCPPDLNHHRLEEGFILRWLAKDREAQEWQRMNIRPESANGGV